MAAKEKINLLEVIPCRSEHITAEREGETIVLSFPRFKYPWMQRFLVPKEMERIIHDSEKKKEKDSNYFVWGTLIIMGVLIAIAVILWAVFIK